MAGGKNFSTCELRPTNCQLPGASQLRQANLCIKNQLTAQQMASFICVFCAMLAQLPAKREIVGVSN